MEVISWLQCITYDTEQDIASHSKQNIVRANKQFVNAC